MSPSPLLGTKQDCMKEMHPVSDHLGVATGITCRVRKEAYRNKENFVPHVTMVPRIFGFMGRRERKSG